MSESYTKLFSTITASTIWGEPLATRVVWITMLAMADRNGEVQGSIPGLARIANVTLAECESALESLKSPDKYSRTSDHEGRRIAEIEGGWVLLNHAKYRARLSEDDKRRRQREWVAAKRAKERAEAEADEGETELDTDQQASTNVDSVDKSTESTHTKADTDTKAKQEQSKSKRPRKSAAALAAPLPEWLSPDLWRQWVEHRDGLKKPLSEKAAELSLKTLAALRADGCKPADVIECAIERGWQGLFAPPADYRRNRTEPHQQRAGPQSRNGQPSKTRAAIENLIGARHETDDRNDRLQLTAPVV